MQKQLSSDDDILLFGIACLIVVMVLLFVLVDKMYMVEATETEMIGVELSSNFIEQTYDFQKLVTVTLILIWCSIISIKFSYLFLFKKLINRIRSMIIYWWFTVIFNVMISSYEAVVYVAACSDYYNIKSCTFSSLQCFVLFSNDDWRSVSSSMCIRQWLAQIHRFLAQSDGVRYCRRSSQCVSLRFSSLTASELNSCISLVHSLSYDLKSENQLETEACLGINPLPYYTDNPMHHYSNRENSHWPHCEIYWLDMRNVLTVYCSKYSADHDLRHRLPHIFRIQRRWKSSRSITIQGNMIQQRSTASSLRICFTFMAIQAQGSKFGWRQRLVRSSHWAASGNSSSNHNEYPNLHQWPRKDQNEQFSTHAKCCCRRTRRLLAIVRCE